MKRATILAALFAMIGIASANMLTNPGFESYGDDGYGNLVPTGWGVYTEGWNWGNVYHRAIDGTGDQHGGNVYWATSEWGGAYLVELQDLGVIAANTYTLSVWAKKTDAQTVKIGFDYFSPDQSQWWGENVIDITADLTTEWKQFSYTTYINGDPYVKVKFVTVGGGVWYDDAMLVPEPASLALLGLGGLLVRRKK